jgi:hypothetical protein
MTEEEVRAVLAAHRRDAAAAGGGGRGGEQQQEEEQEQQQQQEQEEQQLAGRHVHLLVRHLMPQLGALFSPPVSPVPVPVEAPPPPPAPLTTTATTRGGTARAADLDELQQMQTSKALYTASDFVGAIEGFKRTVSLVRKRQRKQRGSEAQVQNGEGAALVAEAYLLMGRCFMGEVLCDNLIFSKFNILIFALCNITYYSSEQTATCGSMFRVGQ